MDFKTIVNCMFQNKTQWQSLSDTDKEEFFFIVNRFMAKKYPVHAQKFNDKHIDKATAMDIWFMFMKRETRVPFWFWKGPTKKKDPEIKGWQLVMEFNDLNMQDIYTLCEMFPDDVKEEVKRIELIKKETEK